MNGHGVSKYGQRERTAWAVDQGELAAWEIEAVTCGNLDPLGIAVMTPSSAVAVGGSPG